MNKRKPRWLPLLMLGAALSGAIVFFWQRPNGGQRPLLSIYIWSGYIDQDVVAAFESEHQATVVQDHYSSNEEMIARLLLGTRNYDIVVPSDYAVRTLVEQDLLAELDSTLIPNRSHLAPEHAAPEYDPGGRFTVPYLFGTTGIAYDSSALSRSPTSWSEFFSEDLLLPLDRRVSLLDDSREVLGAALKSLGKSLNTTSPDDVGRALEILQGVRPFIGRFDTKDYKDLLASGQLLLAQAYSGEALRLAKIRPEIRYVIPTDGATLYTDNLAISAASEQKELAHAFINFLHRPEVNARLATALQYGTPNAAAFLLLPQEDRDNPYLYPTTQIMSRLERMVDVGDDITAFDDAWITLRAADLDESIDEGVLDEEQPGDVP
jgi:spermidine/putrescine-binding protein